jgi:hypothetical protein
VTEPTGALPPAFYAPALGERTAWADWWTLLHPPYTLWHLSYVAIGASLSARFDGGRLAATLLAFLLAVGVGAHALDELHGRPLGTAIPRWALIAAAVGSISGAVALGVVGLARVGPGLGVFIVVGVALNCLYNLELVDGLFHTDVVFAAGWGAFPLLTAYFAQAETIRPAAVVAALGAYWLSVAQRSLSTPARTLRRRVISAGGSVVCRDGTETPITRSTLLAPIETALKTMTWSIVSLAVAFVAARTWGW